MTIVYTTKSPRVELPQVKIYTMRELNQRTAQVIAEINESGVPAVVTRHGRFLAMITPLENSKIESMVLSTNPVSGEVDDEGLLVVESEDPETFSSEEVLAQYTEKPSSED